MNFATDMPILKEKKYLIALVFNCIISLLLFGAIVVWSFFSQAKQFSN